MKWALGNEKTSIFAPDDSGDNIEMGRVAAWRPHRAFHLSAVLPGQADECVTVQLGYGRTRAG